MYARQLLPFLVEGLAKNPVVTVVGPRQSGKTTLCRAAFPDLEYLSLEDPDLRIFARDDPRGFFRRFPGSLILDEVQRVPELTSYVQTLVDAPENDGRRFVITGSHNLLLMEAVSQSLAGRTRVFELLPFSQREVIAHEGPARSLEDVLLRGGYFVIYQRDLEPRHWYKDYFNLYVERDVRAMTQVTNLDAFERFTRLCAGRAGQLLNFSNLANEAGVSQPTAKAWFSALRTTFICFTLSPHHRNFNKRVVKTPKLYFHDTGVLCFLLGIEHAEQLHTHPLRGAIFENFVVSELLKARHNEGETPRLFFWRDRQGLEVDVVEERGASLFPTEIKMSATFSPSFLSTLRKFNALQAAPTDGAESSSPAELGRVICAVGQGHEYQGFRVQSWTEI